MYCLWEIFSDSSLIFPVNAYYSTYSGAILVQHCTNTSEHSTCGYCSLRSNNIDCVVFCKIVKKMVENVENMLYNRDKLFGKIRIGDCIGYTKMI